MTLLEANPSLALGFLNVHELSRGGDAAMKADLTDLASKETPAKIEGSLSGYATLLLQDYQRSLRTMGPHDPRYVARLGDEARLQDLLARVQSRCEGEAAAMALPFFRQPLAPADNFPMSGVSRVRILSESL